jgi:hypothetical protein
MNQNPPTQQTTEAPPAQTDPVGAVRHKDYSSAKDIVLQWLSYTLWAWSLATIATLLSSSLTYFIVSDSRSDGSYEWQLYFVAAMLCLVPAAFFVDRIFSRKEQPKKHGFSAVVMVLNAVAVFLCALGSSIAFVIGILQLLLSSGNTSGTQVLIISSGVTAVLTFALFFRTLNPDKLRGFSTVYRYVMLGVSLLALVLTFSGPFVRELSLKDDRLIERSIGSLSESIRDYASKEGKLPESLEDLRLEGSSKSDQRTLVERGLVTYKRESTSTNTALNSANTLSYSRNAELSALRYQLCTTFKSEKDGGYSSYYEKNEYQTYISAYTHPKGEVCYKLKAGY